MLDDEKTSPSLPDKAAIIAPTMITEEIAFVTLMVYVTMVLPPYNIVTNKY